MSCTVEANVYNVTVYVCLYRKPRIYNTPYIGQELFSLTYRMEWMAGCGQLVEKMIGWQNRTRTMNWQLEWESRSRRVLEGKTGRL